MVSGKLYTEHYISKVTCCNILWILCRSSYSVINHIWLKVLPLEIGWFDRIKLQQNLCKLVISQGLLIYQKSLLNSTVFKAFYKCWKQLLIQNKITVDDACTTNQINMYYRLFWKEVGTAYNTSCIWKCIICNSIPC